LFVGVATGASCFFESASRTNELCLFALPKIIKDYYVILIKLGLVDKSNSKRIIQVLLSLSIGTLILLTKNDNKEISKITKSLTRIVFGNFN